MTPVVLKLGGWAGRQRHWGCGEGIQGDMLRLELSAVIHLLPVLSF